MMYCMLHTLSIVTHNMKLQLYFAHNKSEVTNQLCNAQLSQISVTTEMK